MFYFFKKVFLEHPNSIGESYFQHLSFAFRTGVSLTLAGIACTIHAIFPCIFKEAASSKVQQLYKSFSTDENRSQIMQSTINKENK